MLYSFFQVKKVFGGSVFCTKERSYFDSGPEWAAADRECGTP